MMQQVIPQEHSLAMHFVKVLPLVLVLCIDLRLEVPANTACNSRATVVVVVV